MSFYLSSLIMKLLTHSLSWLFLFANFALIPAHAETAASAIAVMRKARGEELVKNLIEMKGLRGAQEPPQWVLLCKDSKAQGGIREIIVENGAVISERTPLRNFGGVGDLPVLSLSKIKLDSNIVFHTAHQTAIQHDLEFHWLNYTLRTNMETGKPCWFVGFIDYLGVHVGDMVLSAENLAVISPLRIAEKIDIDQATVHTSERSLRFPKGGVLGKAEKLGVNVGQNVRRHTLNVVGSVQEWLTGERTVGVEEE